MSGVTPRGSAKAEKRKVFAMKQEIAIRIAEALESGLYPQTTGCLRDRKGFCCLGVASDLHSIETGRHWRKTDTLFPEYMGEANYLAPAVLEWSGFHAHTGCTVDGSNVFEGIEPPVLDENGGTFKCLATANDAGVSFELIAKALRRNWSKL